MSPYYEHRPINVSDHKLALRLLFFVGIIVYIWQIYDAYKCAQRYNREHMMRCPRCGNPVPMGAVACPTCGAVFED